MYRGGWRHPVHELRCGQSARAPSFLPGETQARRRLRFAASVSPLPHCALCPRESPPRCDRPEKPLTAVAVTLTPQGHEVVARKGGGVAPEPHNPPTIRKKYFGPPHPGLIQAGREVRPHPCRVARRRGGGVCPPFLVEYGRCMAPKKARCPSRWKSGPWERR